MTPGEKRAYSRGYSTGRRDKDRRMWRLLKIASAWRTKALDGFGGERCSTCALWTRCSPRVMFGTCAQEYLDAVDRGMIWAETEPLSSDSKRAQLVTHDNFSCQNWRPAE